MAPVTAQALTLKEFNAYKRNEQTEQRVTFYIYGLAHGADFANTMSGLYMGTRLYCRPFKLMLDGDIAMALVEQEIEAPLHGAYEDNTMMEMIVVNALKNRFPCKEGQAITEGLSLPPEKP